MRNQTSMKSLTSLAKYLGTAKSGFHHWMMQRVSALALIPLLVWMLWHVPYLIKADQKMSVEWLSHPLNLTPLVLLLSALFYHATLGMQVVIEDYVGSKGMRFMCIVCLQFFAICLWMTGVVMALFLVFGLQGQSVSSI